MPGSTPLAIPNGKTTKVRVALLPQGSRAFPNAVTLGNGTNAATVGATQISVAATFAGTATATRIQPGQYLNFISTADAVFLAKVGTTAYTSGTALVVEPLKEAIPAGCTARFPVEFRLRTDASVQFQTGSQAVNTYDHSVNGDAAIGATTTTFNAPGLYSYYDAGSNTVAYAQRNSLEVFVEREIASPDATIFSTNGLITRGAAIVTGRTQAAPNENKVSQDVTFTLVGNVDEVDPA